MKLETGNVIQLGSGARVLIVGGNANNGGNDGVGYVNANNGLGNTNTNYGARLATKALTINSDNVSPYLSTVNRGSPTKTLVPCKISWNVSGKLTHNMKRIGYIFDQIASVDNLRKAHFEAKMSHKPNRRKAALRFESDLENNLLKLHDDLVSGRWHMHPYRNMIRIERGKVRNIFYSSSHEDSVVQHAIIRTLGRRIEKTFIRDTYASIPNRGTHDGLKRIRALLKKIPSNEMIYVGKYDIRKFYDSIDHDTLKACVNRKIKDSKAARLLCSIVDSHTKGIPIGNPVSPMFANLLLSDLDHAAKEKFRLHGYFRYLDDIVCVEYGDDAKERLKEFQLYLHECVERLKLTIKPNEQIFPIERGGIDFLGYVISRTRIRLRKKTERRFRRAVTRFKRTPNEKNRATLSSYWGAVKWLSQSRRFWHTFFTKPIYELEVSQ